MLLLILQQQPGFIALVHSNGLPGRLFAKQSSSREQHCHCLQACQCRLTHHRTLCIKKQQPESKTAIA